MKLNVPTLLTLLRLVVAPIVLPVLLVYLLPYNVLWINVLLAILFLMFSFTDFLDGFLARHLGQETQFGKLLDHVADKFLIYSTLVALVAAQKIFFVWVLIFIGREFFIMGLRLLAQESQLYIPVSRWGKLKALALTCYVAAVIANPDHNKSVIETPYNQLELILLIIALVITTFSAYRYYRGFMHQLEEQQKSLQALRDAAASSTTPDQKK